MKKRNIALFLALALVFGVAVGGTIAWLTDTTAKIDNVFTVGNVDIDLTEEAENFKMSPGATITKDPIVTVKANSEACWVFVKIEESANLDDYISYTVNDKENDGDWTALAGVDGVYYIQQAATTADVPYSVLLGDKVTVNEDVTNKMMDDAKTSKPTLSFTAYAIQQDGFADAAAAWTEISTNGATQYTAPTT